MTDENEMTITMQYSVGSVKITEEYKYSLTSNALSLTDKDRDTTIFVRQTAVLQSADAGLLLGQWADSADMSGYNFKDGGIVEITYVNFTVPVVNMPINSTQNGTYTVSGNNVTISRTIGNNTNINTFTFSVENNVLTLVDTTDGSISTYRRK